MISKNFFESLELLANERGLSIESILEKVEMAMGVACRDTEYVGEIKIDVDFEKKKIRFFEHRYVVSELTEGNKGEILVEDAQILKPRLKMKPGMEIKTEIDETLKMMPYFTKEKREEEEKHLEELRKMIEDYQREGDPLAEQIDKLQERIEEYARKNNLKNF